MKKYDVPKKKEENGGQTEKAGRLGAVITAAGLSSRMGAFKPLLPYKNTTMLRYLVELLRKAGAEVIVVVIGYRAEELWAHLADLDVVTVENREYAKTEMFDSIRLGLGHLAGLCGRAAFVPVDVPELELSLLCRVFGAEGRIVRPVYHGRPGHPVVLDAELIPKVCAYAGDRGFRGALESLGCPITEIEAENDGIYNDIDTAEDYRELLRRGGAEPLQETPEILTVRKDGKEARQGEAGILPGHSEQENEISKEGQRGVPAVRQTSRTMYLVRHGAVEFPGGEKRCIGRTDLPLSKAGRSQAEELREFFAGREIEAFYASPLKRAIETAQIAAGAVSGERKQTGEEGGPGTAETAKKSAQAANGQQETAAGAADLASGGAAQLRVRAALTEIDMGLWENQPLASLNKRLEDEAPEGETRRSALQRFSAEIDRILAETSGDVVIVAHAGVICAYLSARMNTPLETSRGLRQPYGALNIFAVRAGSSPKLVEYGVRAKRVPSGQQIRELYQRRETPERVIRHCEAVAAEAQKLAAVLNETGAKLDESLIYVSALLHDVERVQKQHAKRGGELLLKEGYPQVADVIRQHHELDAAHTEEIRLDEAAVVFYADKRYMGERRVTLEERFAKSAEKCRSKEAQDAHTRRFRQAQAVEAQIRERLGMKFRQTASE